MIASARQRARAQKRLSNILMQREQRRERGGKGGRGIRAYQAPSQASTLRSTLVKTIHVSRTYQRRWQDYSSHSSYSDSRGGDYDAPFYMALQESRALQRRSRNSYYGQLNNRPKKPVDDWTYEELRDAINVPRGFHFGGTLYTEKDVSCFHFVFFLSFSLT